MLTLRRMSVEAEFLKWILLLAIAAAIALLLATKVASGNEIPGLLPANADQISRPIVADSAAPFFPEVGPPLRTNRPTEVLWRILDLHRAGMVEEAIAAWDDTQLIPGTEVWRHIALAAANLQAARLDDAEQQLDAALAYEPDNAVAHYYVALLRLGQAQGAHNWMDMIVPPNIALIALPQIAPNTRDMYELAAMQEFNKAIEFAPLIDLQAPLAPYAWSAQQPRYPTLLSPTVNDLLAALSADHFAARAHNMLGEMKADRGLYAEAEYHLDLAAAEQMNAPLAYRNLARQLEQEGSYHDAARVYLKAFRHGDVNLIPAIKIFVNGWKAADR